MTYWIYLAITVFIVATPGIVRNDMIPLDADPTIVEMLLLLVFACSALIIHYQKDRALHKFTSQCVSCRRELRDISKDLSSSYTYIGEINRKIEILTDLASKLPDDAELQTKEMEDIEHSILKAVESFSDSKNFYVGLYDVSDRSVIATLSDRDVVDLPKPNLSFLETDGVHSVLQEDIYFIRTNRNDISLVAFAVIRKATLRSANIELIKTALQKLLFLRTYKQRRTREINSLLALD